MLYKLLERFKYCYQLGWKRIFSVLILKKLENKLNIDSNKPDLEIMNFS